MYGRKAKGRRSLLEQDTLTQMNFIHSTCDADFLDHEDEQPRKRRRKTTGDLVSSTSTYHTQTITQLGWNLPYEEEVTGNDPLSPVSLQHRQDGCQEPVDAPGTRSMLQTPSKRQTRLEIPSSQSPATPLLDCSTQTRSPLTNISANIFNRVSLSSKPQTNPQRNAKLVIKDTFDSATDSSDTHLPSSPPNKSTPAKNVRFAIEEDSDGDGQLPDTPSKKGSTRAKRIKSPVAINASAVQVLEIPDSDADSDDDYVDDVENSKVNSSTSYTHRSDYGSSPPRICNSSQSSATSIQSPAGEPVLEVAASLVRKAKHKSVDSWKKMNDENGSNAKTSEYEPVEQQSHSDSGTINASYQQTASAPTDEETERQAYSMAESQRLNTQHFNRMAPRSFDSDIFVTLHPSAMADIVSRLKDHDFRVYRFGSQVVRMWIYEAQPVRMLRYMACIGPAKLPGQIENLDGKGNQQFNAKRQSRNFAYEILSLYELASPLSLAQLRERSWLDTVPRTTKRVPPAVLDELMANLTPPLFTHDERHLEASSSWEDLQDVEAQMMDTMLQFTQVEERPPWTGASSQILPAPSQVSSPQTERFPSAKRGEMHTSQATTVDLSQASMLASSPGIVRESPARPTVSLMGRDMSDEQSEEEQESQMQSPLLEPILVPSSQLISRSQMLPDSLMQESLRAPPEWLSDSDRASLYTDSGQEQP